MIWDFDGTLAERDGLWSGALVEAAALEGVQLRREALSPFLQEGFPWHSHDVVRGPEIDAMNWWEVLNRVLVRAYIDGGGLDNELPERIVSHVRQVYLAPQQWRVFPDVEQCLVEMSRQRWRHVILSNHVPELQDLVRSLGIAHHFDAIFSSGITGVEKPNPGAFQLVLDHAGAGAELLMIGDSWTADICGAAALGIRGILVRRPHRDAACFCDSLSKLHLLPWCSQ